MFRPSNYIQSFDNIQAGDNVFLACRVSTRSQDNDGNNKDQNKSLRAIAKAKGATVVGVRYYVGKANGDKFLSWLYELSKLAERNNAKLLAESTSRFVRHPEFKVKATRKKKPGIDELHDMRAACGGVPLVTVHNPDLNPDDETGFQSKRGMTEKNKMGGRKPKEDKSPGFMNRRREKNLPEVLRLHGEGLSNYAIKRKTGIPESTVRLWVRSFLNHDQTAEFD